MAREDSSVDERLNDALSSIRAIGEETSIAGFPPGDRAVILNNVRQMRMLLTKAVDALHCVDSEIALDGNLQTIVSDVITEAEDSCPQLVGAHL